MLTPALAFALLSLEASAPSTLELRPCTLDGVPLATKCGTLTVPEDRTRPDGRDIGLRVVVVPAVRPSPEPDPVFFLAGGPGQAATEVIPSALAMLSDLRDERDLVFVDQRGTGRSNPLHCPIEGADKLELAFSEVPTPTEELKACLQKLDADPRFYTTPIAMDDLDAVRVALGVEQINLVGVSYGTRAGLIYLRRHGAHARAAVLDGLAPVAIHLPAFAGEDAHRALQQLFDSCAADAGCNTSFPDLQDRWEGLLTRLSQAPMTAELPHPRTAEPLRLEVTAVGLAGAVRFALYDPGVARLLPLAIDRASRGDFGAFVALASVTSNLGDEFSLGMYLSVTCAEDFPRLTDTEKEAAQAALLGRAMIDNAVEACAVWPRGKLPDNYEAPVKSDVPTLLLSGDADPVTPPRWGDKTKASLTRAQHLVAPGTGHNVMGRGCVPKLVGAFLKNPAAKLDTTCLDERLYRPAPFVSANGHRSAR